MSRHGTPLTWTLGSLGVHLLVRMAKGVTQSGGAGDRTVEATGGDGRGGDNEATLQAVMSVNKQAIPCD
jgi:hypothetical protein